MDELTIQKIEEQSKITPTTPAQEMSDYRDTWRVFRIMAEFVEGYNFLTTLQNEVTIFGSARFKETHPYYLVARELGQRLGTHGFTTITGGGPGIMQAANQGAFEVEGESVGLNIQLPLEQRINPYVKKATGFYYFFTRKVMLTSPANAFIFFPGGYGTLDEFFEVVDLIDLQMLSPAPVILVGRSFWEPVLAFVRAKCAPLGSVSEEVMNDWHVVDTAAEAFEHVKDIKDTEKQFCDLSPNNFHCQGNIDWKIFRVIAELVEGFDFVTGMTHAVTVLGTKSITVENPYYEAAYRVGQLLAAHEYSVVTGGKFGIAEAINKGAFEAGGTSIGIGMKVGKGIEVNAYLTRSILFSFPFTRKLIMGAPTKAFVFFPGGFGTLHQLFEILTLIQTKKMAPLPIILYDRAFWAPLDQFIRDMLVATHATIAAGDEELYQIVDSEEEIVAIVEKAHRARHGA